MLEEIIKSIRDYFYKKNFHEVIIPILNKTLPLEPNIYAFKVRDYYLPTSPEATLKKAIAKGIGNCFAIGSTFRDMEDTSPIHRPEFLMLEWYREDADYKKIMEETRELILYCHKVILASESTNATNASRILRGSWSSQDDVLYNKWPMLSLVDLFQKYAKLNLSEIIDDKKMLKTAKTKGYETDNVTWEQLFNQIFLNEIEPHLPKKPFFLIDYPVRISPLCAKRTDKPYLAERFELYINGIEIANGNTENTDAAEVLKAMEEEEKYRKKAGILSPPIDMEFIGALEKMNGKTYAGIGLGIDRLTMIIAGVNDIQSLQGLPLQS